MKEVKKEEIKEEMKEMVVHDDEDDGDEKVEDEEAEAKKNDNADVEMKQNDQSTTIQSEQPLRSSASSSDSDDMGDSKSDDEDENQNGEESKENQQQYNSSSSSSPPSSTPFNDVILSVSSGMPLIYDGGSPQLEPDAPPQNDVKPEGKDFTLEPIGKPQQPNSNAALSVPSSSAAGAIDKPKLSSSPSPPPSPPPSQPSHSSSSTAPPPPPPSSSSSTTSSSPSPSTPVRPEILGYGFARYINHSITPNLTVAMFDCVSSYILTDSWNGRLALKYEKEMKEKKGKKKRGHKKKKLKKEEAIAVNSTTNASLSPSVSMNGDNSHIADPAVQPTNASAGLTSPYSKSKVNRISPLSTSSSTYVPPHPSLHEPPPTTPVHYLNSIPSAPARSSSSTTTTTNPNGKQIDDEESNQEEDEDNSDAGEDGNESDSSSFDFQPMIPKNKLDLTMHYPRLCFFANRLILPDEELTIDYGDRSRSSLINFPWLARQ